MKTASILCLLFAAVCFADVTVTLNDITVLLGETATIPCKYVSDAASDDVPTYTWSRILNAENGEKAEKSDLYVYKKDDRAVSRRVDKVVRTGLVVMDGSLVIPNVELDDNFKFGTLRCEVDLGASGKAHDDMKFIAALLPTGAAQMSLNAYSENQQGFTMGGFPLAVASCTSSPSHPPAEIKFFKNGLAIGTASDDVLDEIMNAPTITKSKDGISSISTKDLMKTLDKTDHQAEYTCNVRTKYGDQVFEKNYTMPKFNVNYPTEMVKFVDLPTAILGETITLKCESDGFPQATIKINEEGVSEKMITITEDMNGNTYQCSAYNEPGQTPVTSEVYTVEVISVSKPAIDDIEIVDNVGQVREGDVVAVTCSASGNPKPAVAWYKGDSKFSNDGTLNFENVKFEDTAEYSCKATNGYGQLDKMTSFTLDVRGLKRVGSEEELVEGKIDEKVHLECAVEANPEPKFSWNIEGSDEASFTKTGITYISQLEVGPLTPELSEKVYECSFENDEGKITKKFKLPVIAASGSPTVIIIVILLLILVIAIVVSVLYKKEVICKKQEKGDESAEGDLEVAMNKEEVDVESGNGKAPSDSEPPVGNAEEEKLMNGNNRED